MESKNRRIRRTHRSLHNALMSLILEKNYDSVTVQEIIDRGPPLNPRDLSLIPGGR
jgi:hypothetical protein